MKQITNQQAWDYSLDMIKVDGLTPSNEFLEMVEREKKGEITTDEMRDVVLKRYIPESALTHKCHRS